MVRGNSKNGEVRTTRRRRNTKRTVDTDPEEKNSSEQTQPEQEQPDSATAIADQAEQPPEQARQKEKATEEESIHAKYERIKKGNLHITDLQNLTVAELHNIAKNEGLKEYTGLKSRT